jgi:hypothetical protein
MEDIKSIFTTALQETMQMARHHAMQEADLKHQLEYVTKILPVLQARCSGFTLQKRQPHNSTPDRMR